MGNHASEKRIAAISQQMEANSKKEVSSGSPFIIFYSAPECLAKLETSYAPPMPATVVFALGEESSSLPSSLFGSVQCSSSHYCTCSDVIIDDERVEKEFLLRRPRFVFVEQRITTAGGN